MKKILSLFCSLLFVFVLVSCDTTTSQTAQAINESTSISVVKKAKTAKSKKATKTKKTSKKQKKKATKSAFNYKKVPKFSGKPYYVVNKNKPYFTDKQKKQKKSFESYSKLDSLGRCGVAISCIGRDIQPTAERGEIGMIKPSGWHTVKYDCVDGKYLYNRCHLIGYQLTGENANERNLITGTRYMNVDGMLPFENKVDDYLEKYNRHVLYRVTPIFVGKELVARGVLMEAYSVEDKGKGICFNVFCYNNQPGVTINYSNGESYLKGEKNTTTTKNKSISSRYILNTNSKKFHYENCKAVNQMSDKNKDYFSGQRGVLIDRGYTPCKICNP